jgi:small subunit ribosomal protein S21
MNKKQKQHQTIVPGNALAVNVVGTAREDLASAIKIWKRKIKSSNILETVKNRKEYIKPTMTRKIQKQKAVYIQKIKDLNNK